MSRDLRIMESPHWWPDFPTLKVERRAESRPLQPVCFVRAESKEEVEPMVFASAVWPPEGDLPFITFRYEDLELVVSDGWKPVFLLD